LATLGQEKYANEDFITCAQRLTENLTNSIENILTTLAEIAPSLYIDEPFIHAILSLTPGEKFGSDRPQVIQTLATLGQEKYANEDFITCAQRLSKGLTNSIEYILTALVEIAPSLYIDEPFMHAALSLTQEEKAGYMRTEVIKTLAVLGQEKYANKEFITCAQRLIKNLRNSIENILTTLAEIAPSLYIDEPFIHAVLSLTPGEKSGYKRLEVVKILAAWGQEKYANEDFITCTQKLSKGITSRVNDMLIAIAEIEPSMYTDEVFIDMVLKITLAEKSGNVRAEVIKTLAKIDKQKYLNPIFYQNLIYCLSKDNRKEKLALLSFLRKLPSDLSLKAYLEPLFNAVPSVNNIRLFYDYPDFFSFPRYVKECIDFIEENKNKALPSVLLEVYLSQIHKPANRNKILDLFTQLKATRYDQQYSQDSSLLEQITYGQRLGRRTDTTYQPNPDERNYFIAQGNSFKDGLHLGGLIKQYFDEQERPHDAYYAYTVYQDTTQPCKGTIIDYYGGFASTFQMVPTLLPDDQLWVSKGYRIIYVETRDSIQSFRQANQFSTQTQLLQDTTITLLLFTKTFREKYPNGPVYFRGNSFGGAKGIFTNLVLSNKGKLKDVFSEKFDSLAQQFETVLTTYDISEDLFSGYILHNGWYGGLFENSVFKKYYIKNPVLLLQNFDDERVTTDQVLSLYQVLKEGSTLDQNIELFITPQGAKSFLQKNENKDDFLSTALEGHFQPALLRYRTEYNKRLLNFLERPQGDEQLRRQLNTMRHQYNSTLWGGKSKEVRTTLYRLYYANLLDKNNKSSTFLERLKQVFSQYANMQYPKLKGDTVFETIDEVYDFFLGHSSLWLINKIVARQDARLSYMKGIVQKYKQKQDNKNLPPVDLARNGKSDEQAAKAPLLLGSDLKITDTAEYDISYQTEKGYYLTEDARIWLKDKKSPQRLIEKAKDYAYVIDREILEFFYNFSEEKLLSLDDIKRLWSTETFIETRDLQLASRSFSLIKKIHTTFSKVQQVDLLQVVDQWEPISVLLSLENLHLTLQNYSELMDNLLKEEEIERWGSLKDLGMILTPRNVQNVIGWYFQLPKENRSIMAHEHAIVQTILAKKRFKNSEIILDLLRTLSLKNHEYLTQLELENHLSNFVQTVEGMQKLPQDKWEEFFIQSFIQRYPLKNTA
jgi:hypothetical protein